VGATVEELRARFQALHARAHLFVMPNPWDVGSARLFEAAGFEALATTSAGFAWTLGKRDQEVTRDELVRHVAAVAAAISVPLNVDSERCFPNEPGGVAETVRLLADAGASGLSVEDYDPSARRIEDVSVAAERVAAVAEAAHGLASPMVVTGRAENHLHGVDDLDDTIARLVAYRDAGADVVYAPGLADLDQIARVVAEVQVPVNILVLPSAPRVAELEAAGVRRVSTGGALARAAYGAALTGAEELRTSGTARYAAEAPSTASIQSALGSSADAR
jgi:2-methylisocitrate lyase-like PEP mutase family enzyme